MKPRLLLILLSSVCVVPACRNVTPPSTDYESVIASYVDDGHTVDLEKVTLLNLALAETGQLADKAFHYTQAGSDGILIPWALTVETGERLSDVYWSMGHVAFAQRMAFEANVLDDRSYNPRMMQRLIETNLVYGTYDVARKYIAVLDGNPRDKAVRSGTGTQAQVHSGDGFHFPGPWGRRGSQGYHPGQSLLAQRHRVSGRPLSAGLSDG